MSNYRRYRGGKRYYRRRKKKGSYWFRPWVKAASPAVGYLAARAAKSVVKKYLNVEYKSHEASTSGNQTSTPSLTCITCIPQGDQGNQRDGNNVRIVSMLFRFITYHNAAGGDSQVFKVCLFRDKLNASPGTSDPTSSTGDYRVFTADSIVSLRSLLNSKRYVMLMNKIIKLDNASRESGLATYYKKCSFKLKFQDNTTEAPSTNGLWLYMVSDAATNGPAYEYSYRVRFLDN